MTDKPRILVVYYSRSGKTRLVAQKLAELLGADLGEITEVKDRSGALGYVGAGKDTVLKKASILTQAPPVEGYDVVVIGMPVWAFQPPPPIRAYVKQVDLAGKKVCAFCTYDGSGAEKTLAAMDELVPGGLADSSHWKRPRANDSNLDQKLTAWAAEIKTLAGDGE